MLAIRDLTSFMLAAALVIVVPGPATLYVASAARHSARRACQATTGIIAGDLVLITLSGLGFSALVGRWPAVLGAIKLGGALYLGYLGIALVRTRRAIAASPAASEPGAGTRSVLMGLGITLTNPKPLVFFSGFFAMFIDPTTPSRIGSFYALGGIFELINLAYFTTIITVIARLRRTAAFERLAAGRFNLACGAGLILCAALILVSELS